MPGIDPVLPPLLYGQGRFGRFLSQHSYAVYIILIPIIGFLAYAQRGIALGSISKFGLAAMIIVLTCFALVYLVRKILLASRVLQTDAVHIPSRASFKKDGKNDKKSGEINKEPPALSSPIQEHPFSPLGIEPGYWQTDWEGYYLGFSDIHLTASDLAKFGLMVLNDGEYQGKQIVPADWARDSRQIYSENAWKIGVGRNWRDNGYGYQWWSVRAGDHRYSLAWGHGGQQIVLLDAFNMVIVVTVDPLHGEHGDGPWRLEKASLNLVADFIASLPGE